jgi:hypothetical protein
MNWDEHYIYTVSNFNIHWLGWDRIDANPDKEWSDNKILWFVESMVGVVGMECLVQIFQLWSIHLNMHQTSHFQV